MNSKCTKCNKDFESFINNKNKQSLRCQSCLEKARIVEAKRNRIIIFINFI